LAIVETWYGRIFVKAPADPMPVEIPNHAEAVSTRSGLYRLTDVTKPVARSGHGHRVSLSEPSCIQETTSDHRNDSDGSTHAGIGKIPIKLSGNVNIDEVALAKMARERRNAVSGLVVDTKASGSGKVVGHSRSRPCAVTAKGFAAN
jgi:hypothetical protein